MLDPAILDTFRSLHTAACASGDADPDAMTVATAGADGRVHARMVLLKTFDARGFTFFTRYDSDKGAQLDANPRIALCLHWKRLAPPAQVRIEGRAEKLTAAESDDYFATRERLSQIGAWASLQSRPLADRGVLDQRIAAVEAEYANRGIPRPAEWGGYRVVPDLVEFWHAGAHRWNERERWDLTDARWCRRLLYP